MFYVLEIQKYKDGSYGHLVHTAETQEQAESKYYGVLQYAAISDLPKHSTALLSEDGVELMCKSYTHEEAPTVVPG